MSLPESSFVSPRIRDALAEIHQYTLEMAGTALGREQFAALAAKKK